MPSNFASQFRRSGAPSLAHQFGEDCIYRPINGTPRTVKVIIERLEEFVEGRLVRRINCKAVDDATIGISRSEINDGRDEIDISLVAGETASRRQITLMDDDSNGMVRFRVR